MHINPNRNFGADLGELDIKMIISTILLAGGYFQRSKVVRRQQKK